MPRITIWLLNITLALLVIGLLVNTRLWAAENGDQRYLTMLIKEAVSQRDYDRAERLAVTSEHRSLISEAQQRELEAKLAAQRAAQAAARPSMHCVAIQNHLWCN